MEDHRIINIDHKFIRQNESKDFDTLNDRYRLYEREDEFVTIIVDGQERKYDYNGHCNNDYLNMDIPIMEFRSPSNTEEAKQYYERVQKEIDTREEKVFEIPYMREPYGYDLFPDIVFADPNCTEWSEDILKEVNKIILVVDDFSDWEYID